MSETTTRRQNFIVHPTYVEQIVGEDGETIHWDEPTLYGDLILGGYPGSDDDALGGYYIDLSVVLDDLSEVTVHTCGKNCDSISMGEASKLFLGWHAVNAGEEL